MRRNEKFVIAINRELGSGGRTVGRNLAERLHVEFYDKALIKTLEERYSLTVEEIEKLKGRSHNWLAELKRSLFASEGMAVTSNYILAVPGDKPVQPTTYDMFEAEQEILKNIAEDVKEMLFTTDLVGRIGSNEFVVFMKDISQIRDIEKKIKDIQNIISDTYIGEGTRHKCTVSIGAALFPRDGSSYSELFEKAEKALDLARSKGPNHYDIYNSIKENVYSVLADEIRARNSRIAETSSSRTHPSDSLIERAFKLIEESKDTDSAINLLIRQIVRQMGIDAILIWEKIEGTAALRNLYHCGFDEDSISEGSICEYSEVQWNEAMRAFEEGDGIVVNGNIDDAKDEISRLFMITYGIESLAGCAFYDKGSFVGVMEFIDFGSERKWTDDELKNIRNIANVVSSYLLKMKAYERATATVERLAGYDNVTGLYKYERFLEHAGEYIANAEHGNYPRIYLDVFNFKFVNETYG